MPKIKKSLLAAARRYPRKHRIPLKQCQNTCDLRGFQRHHPDPDYYKKTWPLFTKAWKRLKGKWVTVRFGSVRHGHVLRQVEMRPIFRRAAFYLARLLDVQAMDELSDEEKAEKSDWLLSKLNTAERYGGVECRPKN